MSLVVPNTSSDEETVPQQACFVAGTPVVVKEGFKRVEDVKLGDEVACKSDGDPWGELYWRVVDRLFKHDPTPILGIEIAGRLIRGTANHLYYAEGRGWIKARELRVGDQVIGHDGRLHAVTAIIDNGEVEPVYNFAVAEHHTYFVASQDGAVSALVHNDYIQFHANGVYWVNESTNPPTETRIGELVAPGQVSLTIGNTADDAAHGMRLEQLKAEAARITALKKNGQIVVLVTPSPPPRGEESDLAKGPITGNYESPQEQDRANAKAWGKAIEWTVIEAANVQDANNKLRAAAQANGPIAAIIIEGHGKAGYQRVGSKGSSDPQAYIDTTPQGRANAQMLFLGLQNSLAPNVEIVLNGCEVAAGLEGAALKKIIESQINGTNVKMSKNPTYSINSPRLNVDN